MTYVTGTWNLHWYTIFDTDIFHAIFDTDVCHAICDMWHPVLILAILYLTCDTWPRYLSCYTYHLTLDTDTWYVVLDTCSWHPVYDKLSCGTNTWTWHLDPWPNITTPDTCIHMTYIWLSLLWGHDMTIILLPVLLYTWTPEIGRLLTLLLILYYCWPRNRITMHIDYCGYSVDIITGQIIISRQLTPEWGKLMITDIVSMFMMAL